ncbi:MAG: TMEM165/GDT1 family protein [Reyranellaceae bacterium]
MEAFLASTAAVALAEIGDKTQLLALLLASRYRKPLPIAAGILLATLLNHALAAWGGTLLAGLLDGPWLRWIVGLSFLAMAVWTLIPDRLEAGENGRFDRHGAFLATAICFFLVEIGDKTQIATVALAAKYHAIVAVTAGTTLGMMLANMPVLWLGNAAAGRLPLQWIRPAAALLFAALGGAALVSALS